MESNLENWSRSEVVEEYKKKISALQYTIGERERLKALWAIAAKTLEKSTAGDIGKIMSLVRSTPAERFQDIFALLLSGTQQNGYFVEFGACDGETASNTLTLEQHFGWTGILAEPGECWHRELRLNRTCRIDTRCVSSESGNLLDFHEAKTPKVSSLYSNHRFLDEIDKSYTVATVSLFDLLKEHAAPSHVDFLSIDCEGHEMEVLRSFDFDSYDFGFICVEQHAHVGPESDVSSLFLDAGYQPIFPRHPDKRRPPSMQVTGIDLFFVRPDNPFLNAHEWIWKSA